MDEGQEQTSYEWDQNQTCCHGDQDETCYDEDRYQICCDEDQDQTYYGEGQDQTCCDEKQLFSPPYLEEYAVRRDSI